MCVCACVRAVCALCVLRVLCLRRVVLGTGRRRVRAGGPFSLVSQCTVHTPTRGHPPCMTLYETCEEWTHTFEKPCVKVVCAVAGAACSVWLRVYTGLY